MLMLSRVDNPQNLVPKQLPIVGFEGERKTVLVVDDETNHRRLIDDLLTPIGFTVLEAQDAKTCLAMIDKNQPSGLQPDIFLIDVSMPDMNGLDLAQILREQNITTPIIMISADAHELHTDDNSKTAHDAYMVKPIKLLSLQEQLAKFLDITWCYESPNPKSNRINTPANKTLTIPDHPAFSELSTYAEIGYAKGFREKLQQIESLIEVGEIKGVEPALITLLNKLYKQMRFSEAVELLSPKANPTIIKQNNNEH